MRCLVCLDVRDWETVVRSSARYLGPDDEPVMVHVLDERAARGYDLAVGGLLGRRGRGAEDRMASDSEAAAERLLSEASALISELVPGISAGTSVLTGLPGENLVEAARTGSVRTLFIGRSGPGGETASISGVLEGWRRNHPGDVDGFYTRDGVEVRFPPHRAAEVERVVREGADVLVSGEWKRHHLHAYRIANPLSGESVEAHPPPDERHGARVGHTARFVMDHVSCDVVLLTP